MEQRKSAKGTPTGGRGGEGDAATGKKANRKNKSDQEKREGTTANKEKQSQTGRPISTSSSVAGGTDKSSRKRGGRADTTAVKENAKGSKQDVREKGGGSTPCEAETPPPPGHIELKPFQRTPKQLLHNYCQKQKLPRPRFELRKATRANYFRSECILTPSARDPSQKMRFLTEQDWEFKSHSEHFSALLALHALEPTRPYEKLFPSPFKEAWLALSSPPAPAAPPASNQRGKHRAGGASPPAVAATGTNGSGAGVDSSSGGTSADASRKSVESSEFGSKVSAFSCSAAQGSRQKQEETEQVTASKTGGTGAMAERARGRGDRVPTAGAHAPTGVKKDTTSLAEAKAGTAAAGGEVAAAERGTSAPRRESAATTAKGRARVDGGGRRPNDKRKEQNETAGAAGNPAGAANATVPTATFAISNAHRYVSEYQRKQEEEQQRCERARRQKAREQALREQREKRPEVFMAAAVRAAVRAFLFKALRRAALVGPAPPAASGCTGGESELHAASRFTRSAAALSSQGGSATLHGDNASVRPLEWSCFGWLTEALLLFPQFSAGDPSSPNVSTDASTPPQDNAEKQQRFQLRQKEPLYDAKREREIATTKRPSCEQKTRGQVEGWLLQMLQKREGFSTSQAEASVFALLHVLQLFSRNRTTAGAAQGKQRNSAEASTFHSTVTFSGRAAVHKAGSSSSTSDEYGSSEYRSNRTRRGTTSTWEDWEAGDSSGTENEDCAADAVALGVISAQRTRKSADRCAGARLAPAEKQELLRNVLQSCIDWICLNESDESKLPEAYSPLGKQIEVHVFGTTPSTAPPADREEEEEEEVSHADDVSKGAGGQGRGTAARGEGVHQSAAKGLFLERVPNARRVSSGMPGTTSPEAKKQSSVHREQLCGITLTQEPEEAATGTFPLSFGARSERQQVKLGVEVCGASQSESNRSSTNVSGSSSSSASKERERSGETSCCSASVRHQLWQLPKAEMREMEAGSGDAVTDALTCAGELLVGHPVHAKAPACQRGAAHAASLAESRSSGVLRSQTEKSAGVTKPVAWQQATSAAVTMPTTWQEAISTAASNFSSVLAARRSPAEVAGSASAPTTRHSQDARDVTADAALEALRSCSAATWMYSGGLELLDGGARQESLAAALLQQAQKAFMDEEGGSRRADKEQQHRTGERGGTKVVCAGNAGRQHQTGRLIEKKNDSFEGRQRGHDQQQQQWQQDERVAAERRRSSFVRLLEFSGRDAHQRREESKGNEKYAFPQDLPRSGLLPLQFDDPFEGGTQPSLVTAEMAARLEELLQTEQQVVESTIPAASFVLLPASRGGTHQQQPHQQQPHQQQPHQQQPHQQERHQREPHQQQLQHQQPHPQVHPVQRYDSCSSVSGVFGHTRLEGVDIAPLLSFFSLHRNPPSRQHAPATYQQSQPLCVPVHVFLYAPAGSLFPLRAPVVWVSFDLPPHLAQLQQPQQEQQRQRGADIPSSCTDLYTSYGATLAFLSLCVSLTLAHFLASRLDRVYRSCRSATVQDQLYGPAAVADTDKTPDPPAVVRDPSTRSEGAEASVLSINHTKESDFPALLASRGGRKAEGGGCILEATPVESADSAFPVHSRFLCSLRGLSALVDELETTGLGTSTFSEVVSFLQSPAQLLASLSVVFRRFLAPFPRPLTSTDVAVHAVPVRVAAVSAVSAPGGSGSPHALHLPDSNAIFSTWGQGKNGEEQRRVASAEALPSSDVQQRLRMRLQQGRTASLSQQKGEGGKRSIASSEHHAKAPPGIPALGRSELIRRWRTLLRLPSVACTEDEWRDARRPSVSQTNALSAGEQQQPSQEREEQHKQRRGELQHRRPDKDDEPYCELAGSAPDASVSPPRRSYPLTKEICEKILQSREAPSAAEEPRLPVREYEGALQAFMCDRENKHVQVLVLQGETGSGKTTQVPRILLEAAASAAKKQLQGFAETQFPPAQHQRHRQWPQQLAHEQHQPHQTCSGERLRRLSAARPTQEAAKECFIVCSQPRRLAAMSVAARVSAEMNTAVGDVVGYQVRLRAAASSNTRLLFCTHGILLRRLLADRRLSDISVVCLDEVHERSVEVDLLLLILSKTLLENPRIKIVLMSASISAETFAAYFHPDAVLARCSAAFPGQNFSRQPALSFAEEATTRTGEEQQDLQRREHRAVMPAAHPSRGNEKSAAGRGGRCSSGAVATLRVPGRTFPVKIFYAEDLQKVVDFSSLIKAKGNNTTSNGSHTSACAAASVSDRGGRRNALEPQRAENPSGAAADDRWVAAAELSSGLSPASLMCGSRQMPWAVAELVKYIHLKKPQHRTARPDHALCEESAAAPEAAEAAATPRTALEDNERRQASSEVGRNTRESACGAERKFEAAAQGGAILVFSTGVGEVAAVCRAIEELRLPLWVLPCHASLHLKQQQQVFSRAPPGMRKVVVATNIAETSITIPDVSYVIDTGLHKQMHYEVCKRLNQLQEEVISRSSAQQRAGRAGRVGPGECYRLYNKDVFDKLMNQTEKPELQRQPLENVCLQLKAIFPEERLPLLLAQCIEPPSVDAVSTAIRRLCRVGALRVDALGKEHLTAFGSVLSLFPMDLLVARMLLYSATLSCLDEVLALCALMAVESVLYQSHSANPGATEARLKCFSRSQSDFITNLRVFLAWRRQSAGGNCRAEDTFCSTFGVNSQTMRNAEELRKRFSRVVDEVSLRLLQEEEQKRTTGDRPRAPASRRSPQPSAVHKAVCDEITARVEEEEADERIAQSAVLSESDLVGAQFEVKEAVEGGLFGNSELERLTVVEGESIFCSGDGLKYVNQTDNQRNLHRSKEDIGEAETERRARSKFWHIKACVAAGLYPQVALVQTPKKRFTQVASGAVEKVAEAREIKFMAYLDDDGRDNDFSRHGPGDSTSPRLQRVFIHPSSVIFKSGAFETQWVAYMEKVQTTKPFIKEVSTVSVFALLLLSCCGLRVDGGRGILYLDDWIQLRCPGLIGTYLKSLKALFYLLLEVYMQETMKRIREKACTLSQWNGTLSPAGECSPLHRMGDSRGFCGECGQESIFSGKMGNDLRNELVDLVKRLVEFEGHRL